MPTRIHMYTIYIYTRRFRTKKKDKIKWSLGWLGMDNGRPSPSIFDAFAMPAHKKWPRGIQPPQYHQRPIHAKWRTSRSSNPTSLALGARMMVVQTNSLKWTSIKNYVQEDTGIAKRTGAWIIAKYMSLDDGMQSLHITIQDWKGMFSTIGHHMPSSDHGTVPDMPYIYNILTIVGHCFGHQSGLDESSGRSSTALPYEFALRVSACFPK